MSNENAIIMKGQVDRYNLMVDFVKTVMVKERDYGVVPGTAKPTLLKPGAEKLNGLFKLYPDFGDPVNMVVDWDKGMFFYQYRCILRHRETNEIWGTGLGSCNSKESKYRYRYVATDKRPTKEESAELKARGMGKWRKDNDKGWVWMERIENDQIYDIVNTIDKMAQKRALIAATLIACNASEFFTQDVEDIPGFTDVYEAEFTEAKQTELKKPIQSETKTENGTGEKPWTMPDFPEDLPEMSMEMAMTYTTKTGVLYADVPSAELVYHAGSLLKTWRTDENAALKLSAIRTHLMSRQSIPAA